MPESTTDLVEFVKRSSIPTLSAITLAFGLNWAWSNWQRLENRVASLEMRSEPPVIPIWNRWTCLEHNRFMAEMARQNPRLILPEAKRCEP